MQLNQLRQLQSVVAYADTARKKGSSSVSYRKLSEDDKQWLCANASKYTVKEISNLRGWNQSTVRKCLPSLKVQAKPQRRHKDN